MQFWTLILMAIFQKESFHIFWTLTLIFKDQREVMLVRLKKYLWPIELRFNICANSTSLKIGTDVESSKDVERVLAQRSNQDCSYYI